MKGFDEQYATSIEIQVSEIVENSLNLINERNYRHYNINCGINLNNIVYYSIWGDWENKSYTGEISWSEVC